MNVDLRVPGLRGVRATRHGLGKGIPTGVQARLCGSAMSCVIGSAPVGLNADFAPELSDPPRIFLTGRDF